MNLNKSEKFMKLISHIITIVFILSISACASIIDGTDQSLTFNSEPDGATVTVAGKVVGKTPLSVQIDRGNHQAVTFEKEGYKTHSAQLSTSLNGWFWGNILLGGFFGSTTDGVSGAMNEFSPDQYFVTLTPDTPYGLSTSNPRKIKELIIAFGDEIRLELSSGAGEKVSTLLILLNTNDEDKSTAVKALNNLSLSNENDLSLANAIIELYEIQ